MRSRFSAYALGRVDYIIKTTVPMGPQWNPNLPDWQQILRDYCSHTRFDQLVILHAPKPDASLPDEGEVTFEAQLSTKQEDVSFTERSRFLRIDGHWLYHSGQSP